MENKEIDFESFNPVEEEFLHQNLITQNQYNFIKKLQKASLNKKEMNSIALYGKIRADGGKTISQVEENADYNNPYYHYVNIFGTKNICILEDFFCYDRRMKSIEEVDLSILQDIFKILDQIEQYYCFNDYDRLIYRLSTLVKQKGKEWVKRRLRITEHRTLIKILQGKKNYNYCIYENIKKLLKI